MRLPDYLQRHVSNDTRYLTIRGDFKLENGESLPELVIAYQTWGRPENAATNAILICHALTGSADVDAWWPNIIGSGRAFDPQHDYIVCSNILGSCYGTTGPATHKPGGRTRYRADFPRISIRDMVRAQGLLLDELGVQTLELVTGPSLGGMQALEWALCFPHRVRCVVPIGVGGRHSAWCIGVSEAQRAAIAADPNWNDGYYEDDARPNKGLAAARMMAVCNYRSWQSFEQRFGRDKNSNGQFEAQSYLQHQGEKINDRFDANAYVSLTHAMHSHDLARDRGEYPEILCQIKQAALVVSVSTDALYPPAEQRILSEHLANASYEILESAHGHDGFLIEADELGKMIANFRLRNRASSTLRLLKGG
jgi:homoserine O-acetyltransferase